MNRMKIGFFDSGLGGLTILRAVVKHLPEYDYLYYGDTGNLPYGDKSEEEIYRLSEEGMRYLFSHGAQLVIIACNTASAETLRKLQDEFLLREYPDRNILGVIIPTVEEVVAANIQKVALIGTARTVASGKYEREFEKFGTSVDVLALSTPSLVPLIEEGNIDVAFEAVTFLIETKIEGTCEGLILGCTHYTVLVERLRNAFPGLVIFSQDEIIPKKLAAYLKAHPEHEEVIGKHGERTVHLTAVRSDYDRTISEFLGGHLLAH